MRWEFKKLETGMVERQSHSAEFFNKEARPEALVREFIQNSLDARRRNIKTIDIKFTFDRIKFDIFDKYISELKPHLDVCNIKPRFAPERRVFIMEDFGTTGLNGEVSSDKEAGNVPENSNFYDFWWREGVSSKRFGKAGRWGIGKTTFSIASVIKSFWGYTLRYDDNKELLMGRSSLKPHTLKSVRYLDYGTFSQEFLPVIDKNILNKLKSDFAISRKNEPGFSVIVPMPVQDIQAQSIIKYTILHYFFPILKGELNVEIADINSGLKTIINKDSIRDIAMNNDWIDTSWNEKDVSEIFEFSKSALGIDNNSFLKLSESVGEDLKINEESFGNNLEKARELFNNGDIVGITIPVIIERSDDRILQSYYKIFLKKYEPEELKNADEYYIRSGIILPQERCLGNQTVRTIFLVEDRSISSFLGDCEEPAHIKWNENTTGFKEKYKNGVRLLRFIKKSTRTIINILNIEENIIHHNLLKNIFFIEKKEEEKEETEEETITEKPKVPPLVPKKKLFMITPINRGFRIKYIGKKEDIPVTSVIRVAYNIQRGNPFKHYVPLDFDISKNQIKINKTDCEILKLGENSIKFVAKDTGAKLEITNFDEKRDLAIDLEVKDS